jgi:hypothetical protein
MSFFEYMMRNAAPALFWAAVLLFIGSVATTLLIERGITPYGSESIVNASSFVVAVVQGLSAAVWPFTGAGIIWTLQRKRGEGGQ